MKILLGLLFTLMASISMAKETYTIVVASTPGNASDITIRSLADVYKRKTGNTLVIQNIGGGNQIPATVKFANLNTPAIMTTTTSILVFNPVLQKNLPYSLDIFDHVGGVALAPVVWVARTDSPYRSMKDLVDILPKSKKPLIGYATPVEVVNFQVISDRYNWKGVVDTVKYKGTPEVITGMLTGDMDVAVVSNSQVVEAQIRANKIRLIGTTLSNPYIVGDQTAEPVENQIKVKQFTGGIFLSLNKFFSAEAAAKLKADLFDAMKDPEFVQTMNKLGVVPFDNNNSNANLIKFVDDFRNTIKQMNFETQ